MMAIGTSDGKVFESEWDHVASPYVDPEGRPRLTVTPTPAVDIEDYLDPLLPETRYDDTPTPQQNARSGSIYNNLKQEETGMEQKLELYSPSNEPLSPTPLQISQTPKTEENLSQGPIELPTSPNVENTIDRLTTGFDSYKTFGRVLNRVGTGLATLAALPGKVFKGEIDPNTPEGQKKVEQWAREMAMTMVMTPAPLVTKSVDGTLGSIAGIRAQTANKELLDVAVALDKKGYSNNEIWQNSGWFKGSDGKWRHEIPNSDKATVDLKAKPEDKLGMGFADRTLGEVFNYPELYKAYPELKNMKVTFQEIEGELGHYSSEHGSINLSLDAIKKGGTNPIDTIIHEVQHAIQAKEGYVYGTAPSDIGKLIGEEVQKAFKARDIPRVNELYAIADKYLKPKSPELQAIKDELYHRSPGEREANLVEMRRNMTQAEREGYSPSYYRRVADDMYGTSEYRSKVFPEEVLLEGNALSKISDKQSNLWFSDKPLEAIKNSSNTEHLRIRLGQLSRDKAQTKKLGYDVEGSDYMHYNTQIKAIRDRLKELK